MTHQLNLKVYIAGPMTGLPDNNYPAFNQAEKELFVQGHQPLNPAKNKASTWIGFMRRSLHQIAEADCLYMLAGWQTSKGAKIEHQLALDLHLPIFYENELKPKNVNRPESPDIIAAATKEISPGVKEGWTPATQNMKDQVKLAEEAVNAARCGQLSPDHPSTGTDIPKKAERFVVQALDVLDEWVTIAGPYVGLRLAQKVANHYLTLFPGLPTRTLPVKDPV